MKFIKLTLSNTEAPIFININYIVTVEPDSSGKRSWVHLLLREGDIIRVNEEHNYIMEVLNG